MDIVTTVSDKTNDIAANTAGYTARTTKKVLDSDDFMSLLTTQMANQDPLNPMEDTAFVSQMASFTSLAQMNSLTESFNTLSSNNAKATAASYLGSTVTLTDPTTSQEITGTVTSVDISGDEPKVKVDGTYYSISTITNISYSSSTTTTDGTGS